MSRWVLVTGGAVRLGREICLAFGRAGWNVACHYLHSQQAAQELAEALCAQGGQAIAIQGALDEPAGAEAVFRRATEAAGAPPACVVNNASVFVPDAGGDFQPEQMLARLKTNLVVPLLFGRLLHESGADADASVVHILDQKVFNLNPDYFSYTLSKLALERSVAQQAQALAPRVRVNAVAPGLMYPSGPQTRENFDAAARANLLRAPIDPVRVAEAVAFLAGNPSITGSTLCVDNGQHLVPLPRDIMFVVDELLAGSRP